MQLHVFQRQRNSIATQSNAQHAAQLAAGQKGFPAPQLILRASSEAQTHPAPIQRYESPEHQDLGDQYLHELHAYLASKKGAEWAKKYGYDSKELRKDIGKDKQFQGEKITLHAEKSYFPNDPRAHNYKDKGLTPGEIISLMGDFYDSWEELQNAPRSEIDKILRVMKNEREKKIDHVGATRGYVEATKHRPERKTYLGLAQRNTNHFAPQNIQTWLSHHRKALQIASEAGKKKDREGLQQALLIDAAGGHFLTDAFASGHMFDRPTVMGYIQLHLTKHPATATNKRMQLYLNVVKSQGQLKQLVLKNIHDHLNHEGLPISNSKGMTWKTFGDDNLSRATETQRVVALAVFLSRQQIQQAFQGHPINLEEVLELLPDKKSKETATDMAIAYIPTAVQEVEQLIYKNRKVADLAFEDSLGSVGSKIVGKIVESNLDAINDPANNRSDLFDDMTGLRDDKLGKIKPSFTIARW